MQFAAQGSARPVIWKICVSEPRADSPVLERNVEQGGGAWVKGRNCRMRLLPAPPILRRPSSVLSFSYLFFPPPSLTAARSVFTSFPFFSSSYCSSFLPFFFTSFSYTMTSFVLVLVSDCFALCIPLLGHWFLSSLTSTFSFLLQLQCNVQDFPCCDYRFVLFFPSLFSLVFSFH